MDDQEFGFCQVCLSKELDFDAEVIRLRKSIKCKVHVDFLQSLNVLIFCS